MQIICGYSPNRIKNRNFNQSNKKKAIENKQNACNYLNFLS